jgi:hypothetical protein
MSHTGGGANVSPSRTRATFPEDPGPEISGPVSPKSLLESSFCFILGVDCDEPMALHRKGTSARDDLDLRTRIAGHSPNNKDKSKLSAFTGR